jgi:hypothetical protein
LFNSDAVSLNGSSQYLKRTHSTSADLNVSGSQSWFAWIKPNVVNSNGMIVAKHNGTTTRQMLVEANGRIQVTLSGISGGASFYSDKLLRANEWHLVGFVFDATNSFVDVYVNDVVNRTTVTGSSVTSNTADWNIGTYNNGAGLFFQGEIQEVSLFDRVLEPEEISAMYRGGADIRFYTNSALTTQVPHVVRNWNPNSLKGMAGLDLGTDTDLEFYAKFDDDATDESTNSYDLTLSGSPSYTGGVFKSGLLLDSGSSQYGSIADASCANLEISGSQTWTMWVRLDALGSLQTFMSKYDGSSANLKTLQISSADQVQFRLDGLGGTDTYTSTQVLHRNKLYHIVGRYDSASTELSIWIDGKKEGSVTASGSATDTNGDFHLGSTKSLGRYLSGMVDEAAIFSRALTDEEIVSLYENGKPTTVEVKLSSLDLEANNELFVSYGSSSLAPLARDNTYGSDNVFPSDFKGAWMDSNAKDFTSNQNDLTVGSLPDENLPDLPNIMGLYDRSAPDTYYIDDADHTGLDLSGDIFFEGFISIGASKGSNDATIMAKYDTSAANRAYRVHAQANNKLALTVSDNGTNVLQFLTSSVLDIERIYYATVIFDISEETCRMFLDGVQVPIYLSSGTSLGATLHNSTAKFRVGALQNTAANGWDGYLGRLMLGTEIKSTYWTRVTQALLTAPETYMTTAVASTDQTSDRPAVITGELTDNAERSALTKGQAALNDDRAAIVTGTAVVNAERSSILTGVDTANAERSATLEGGLGANADRSATLEGSGNAADADRSSVLTGKDTDTAERSATLTGLTTVSVDRSATLTGAPEVSAERDAIITGAISYTDVYTERSTIWRPEY